MLLQDKQGSTNHGFVLPFRKGGSLLVILGNVSSDESTTEAAPTAYLISQKKDVERAGETNDKLKQKVQLKIILL